MSDRGKVIKSRFRESVINVCDYFQNEKEKGGPIENIEQINIRTSKALKIGTSTVSRIIQEKKFGNIVGGKLKSPGKNQIKMSLRTTIDDFTRAVIRRHIYDYYKRRDYPTASKLRTSLANSDLFNGGET